MCTQTIFYGNRFPEGLDLGLELDFDQMKSNRFHASASEDKCTKMNASYSKIPKQNTNPRSRIRCEEEVQTASKNSP